MVTQTSKFTDLERDLDDPLSEFDRLLINDITSVQSNYQTQYTE